jgi:hypothetical protein
MGYHPGLDYFAFYETSMNEAGTWQLYEKAPEFEIRLGAPKGQYTEENGVWKREFENGVVYVNPDIELAQPVTLINGNKSGEIFNTQTTVTIPNRDAWFSVNGPSNTNESGE